MCDDNVLSPLSSFSNENLLNMDFSAYLASSSEGEVEEEEEKDKCGPVNEEEQIRMYRVSGEAIGKQYY